MKKISLLAAALICIAGHVMAQRCNFDKDETDKFTGKRLVAKKTKVGRQANLFLGKKGDKYIVALGMYFGGDNRLHISVGDTMMIALEQGKPIVLTATNEAKPVVAVARTQIVTQYYSDYEISKEDMERLSQQEITAIRVHFGAVAVDLMLQSKHLDKVEDAAKCILSL